MVAKVNGVNVLPNEIERDVPVVKLVRQFMGDEGDYMNDVDASRRLADTVKERHDVQWEVRKSGRGWHAQIPNIVNRGATNVSGEDESGTLTCCVGMWLAFNEVA